MTQVVEHQATSRTGPEVKPQFCQKKILNNLKIKRRIKK
jgi:hypothetical protein